MPTNHLTQNDTPLVNRTIRSAIDSVLTLRQGGMEVELPADVRSNGYCGDMNAAGLPTRVTHYGDNDWTATLIKPDCSILDALGRRMNGRNGGPQGSEIVTPRFNSEGQAKGDIILSQIATTFTIAQRWVHPEAINDSCGTHTTHALTDRKLEESADPLAVRTEHVRNLLIFWDKYEPMLYKIVGPHRAAYNDDHGYGYAVASAAEGIRRFVPTGEEIKRMSARDVRALVYEIPRNSGLNLTNAFDPDHKKCRVEFRLAPATLDWQFLQAWYTLTQRIVTHTRWNKIRPGAVGPQVAGLGSALRMTRNNGHTPSPAVKRLFNVLSAAYHANQRPAGRRRPQGE